MTKTKRVKLIQKRLAPWSGKFTRLAELSYLSVETIRSVNQDRANPKQETLDEIEKALDKLEREND